MIQCDRCQKKLKRCEFTVLSEEFGGGEICGPCREDLTELILSADTELDDARAASRQSAHRKWLATAPAARGAVRLPDARSAS